MLEILSEAKRKDKIFSDRSLTKAQENLTNIMGLLGCLWAYLDHLKKDNEGVIDLNILLELVEQCVILVGQCHSRGLYFSRQRVLTALFKDRRKVKSILKEGSHCFEKKQKVLFEERFQKKVNKTIKSKKKTKELWKEYTKSTPAKRPYCYGYHQPPFQQGPHPSSSERGCQLYQNQRFVPRDGQMKIYSRGGRGKLESEPLCDTYIQHKSGTKNTRPSKFNRLPKSSPICKNTFLGDQRNFFSSFFEKLVKSYKRFNNPKHSQGLFYRLCGDSLPTKNTNKDKIKPSSGRTCITGWQRGWRRVP